MAVKTIKICTCDICGAENAKNYKAIAYRTFDGTDGRNRYAKPQFETVDIDLCDACAKQVTALHDIGVCCRKFEIKAI